MVLHGSGETDLDKCINWYTHPRGNQPHYLVTAIGSIRRFVDEDHVAYHAGRKPAESIYHQGFAVWSRYVWRDNDAHDAMIEQPRYRTWRETWPGRESPFDLITGASPNQRSIGIEVQSLDHPTPVVFEPIQYKALAELLVDVCGRWKIPIDREHVIGHYDVSPLRRSGPGGSYDPGERFSWDRLWELCREVPRNQAAPVVVS